MSGGTIWRAAVSGCAGAAINNCIFGDCGWVACWRLIWWAS
ncbi:MAG: hypothetical protein U1F59_10870 [Candidatus Competibacteraceae bacterium]